ncbi:DUF4167 domain-containing protein [Agrobacterium tumefaciens]|uniref:DUF4167 domain-containing protein n=1 Tax=Agrobacterium tumefaciens str. Kerr 14 TaxID=1183424 RepID=A0A1S7S4C5_AGRTU|nr:MULTISPECIES: DUF4167 domain-containing protein [Agrobacterium]AYM83952.1 hypothetical protein At12D1_40690 [Agrobacterium tumefaciens]MBP2572990.1 hypothetical protein [Agrobacterium tumefaciens]NTE94281.1 DUF4167 domain-containing protein [Agrobacterium tumefaciens]CUX62481.1 Conserved hypothetical protein [Agrobacterium tumefaciens str. Kerr 14]SNB79948.1 protein of unknown function [Agrobacterium sp. 719_389]
MRPGQQNKRGRGRGSNNNNNGGGNNNNFNRKGGNPLTRTYDSSGPDVKIRGTAQHIAEKYAALARDAQSSGDRVIAENYLQHAEHYNRIIASAQAQMQERFQRDDRGEYSAADGDDMDVNDGDEGVAAPQQQAEQVERAQQPERQERTERNEPRQERRERPDRRERQERQPRQPQVAAEQQPPVYDASQAPQPVIEGTPMEVAVEEEQQQAEAPAAERAPKTRRATGPRPRRPRRTAAAEGAEGEDAPAGDDAAPATLENAAE